MLYPLLLLILFVRKWKAPIGGCVAMTSRKPICDTCWWICPLKMCAPDGLFSRVALWECISPPLPRHIKMILRKKKGIEVWGWVGTESDQIQDNVAQKHLKAVYLFSEEKCWSR